MKLFGKKGKKNKKQSESIAYRSPVALPVLKEFKDATRNYVNSIKHKHFFKSTVLYNTPWYLVMGPQRSGKTTLLSTSNIDFPLKYPIENNAVTPSGVKWLFSTNIVFIDLPGKLTSVENTDLFDSVCQGLSNLRPKRPVDGIICVINIEDLLNGNQDSVIKLAASIRKKLDELIAVWGIELPLFCVFTNIDSIPGFDNFFSDTSVQWADQILGCTLSTEQQLDSPRKVFRIEHDLLCSSLKTLRLKLLSKEKDETVRRLICRFVIQFEGLQAKTGDFFAELFKDSTFEGKPVLKGFYFVSCKQIDIKENEVRQLSQPSLSKTIINHPLNPHRNANYNEVSHPVSEKKINNFFTTKILDELIPNGTQVLSKTSKSSRKDIIRYWTLTFIFAAMCLLFSGYTLLSYRNLNRLHNEIQRKLSYVSKQSNELTEQFKQLESTAQLIEKFKGYQQSKIPLLFGLMKTDKIYAKLKEVYLQQAWNLIVVPATSYLEYEIKRIIANPEILTKDRYASLYRTFKTYLSISEAVGQSRENIDTLVVREIIGQVLCKAILHKEGTDRLPENLETILKNNIGLYCYFLKKGEMQLIQPDQLIVKQARARLSHIPDPKVIYESVRENLRSNTASLTLDEIIGVQRDGLIQCGKNISLIYTQEGYDRFLRNEIILAAKEPFKKDWVLGVYNSEIPVYDKKQMEVDLIRAYTTDLCEQWLSFLSAVQFQHSADMVGSAVFLQKLASEKSEFTLLLENVLKLSRVDVDREKSVAIDLIKKTAEKKLTSAKKISASVDSILDNKNNLDQIKQYFAPLSSFLRSEGRYGGLVAYRERISILSERLLNCAKQGNINAVFTGKDGDPLLSAWALTENLLVPMPDYMQIVLTPILKGPLELSAQTVVKSLAIETNRTWENEIINHFNSKMVGRYPFSKSKEDASFESVMDFFRPNTGVLYGFVSGYMVPYMIKKNGEWKSHKVGCITLPINEQFFSLLSKADKISSVFFNDDGSQKVQTIMLKPLSKNKISGAIIVDQHEYKITPGQSVVRFQWPDIRIQNNYTMKLFVNQSYTDELSFYGPWGLNKLFESARLNTINSTSFVANWERNIQNMIMVHYSLQVQLSESALPFSEQIFSGFTLPLKVINEELL